VLLVVLYMRLACRASHHSGRFHHMKCEVICGDGSISNGVKAMWIGNAGRKAMRVLAT
jgi:hypothetical protein